MGSNLEAFIQTVHIQWRFFSTIGENAFSELKPHHRKGLV